MKLHWQLPDAGSFDFILGDDLCIVPKTIGYQIKDRKRGWNVCFVEFNEPTDTPDRDEQLRIVHNLLLVAEVRIAQAREKLPPKPPRGFA